MTYEVLGPGALDYFPCRYGNSRLMMRGPKRELKSPYIAFVGGTETYGRFIETPFPALVEQAIGLACVNFGLPNAGLDAYVLDPFLGGAMAGGRVTIIQVMGAQSMSNRFYSVHPRRNDRFIGPTQMLKNMYRDVDFADIHFNKHLMNHLHKTSPKRFCTVRRELQRLWVIRMKLLLKPIRGRSVLLWMADTAPPETTAVEEGAPGADPLFVTRQMIEQIATDVTKIVEVVPTVDASTAGTDGMVFGALEATAAAQTLGPRAHQEAASALTKAISTMI